MLKTMTYLFFDGNCAEALAYYEKVLGTRTEFKMTYGESPAAEHVPASSRNHIIHASMMVGDNRVLFSDGTPDHPAGKSGRFAVTLATDGIADAERIFAALSDGGEVGMAMGKTFFAERYGACTDRFGIPWMVMCEKDG